MAHLVGYLATKQKAAILFPDRAHAWVVDLVPGWGAHKMQPIDDFSRNIKCFFPSLVASIHLSLKVNKILVEVPLTTYQNKTGITTEVQINKSS